MLWHLASEIEDGGLDGFVHPVTSVTGALAGVTTGADHTITWDIAADYPDEDIPNAQIRVTAFDDLPELISVGAGSFDMGRTSAGDDATYEDNCRKLQAAMVGVSDRGARFRTVMAVVDPATGFSQTVDGVLEGLINEFNSNHLTSLPGQKQTNGAGP